MGEQWNKWKLSLLSCSLQEEEDLHKVLRSYVRTRWLEASKNSIFLVLSSIKKVSLLWILSLSSPFFLYASLTPNEISFLFLLRHSLPRTLIFTPRALQSGMKRRERATDEEDDGILPCATTPLCKEFRNQVDWNAQKFCTYAHLHHPLFIFFSSPSQNETWRESERKRVFEVACFIILIKNFGCKFWKCQMQRKFSHFALLLEIIRNNNEMKRGWRLERREREMLVSR